MFKVLIVEDEDIIRKGLLFITDWTLYDSVVVGEAIDGNDGLKKIDELRPDIVITDVKMPFKDGIQMLEESIHDYEYETIIISGYGEFEYAKRAISIGVSEYLLKPVDMDFFGKTLQKVTQKIELKRKAKKYLQIENPELGNKLLNVLENKGHKMKYVQKMLQYVENSYNERISISDLSESMGLSSTYLNIKFKEETSYTFNDFLNRYRILRAVKLLKESDMKVYEVANAVGFQDYKYFIQVFKKYTGCSPMKFAEC